MNHFFAVFFCMLAVFSFVFMVAGLVSGIVYCSDDCVVPSNGFSLFLFAMRFWFIPIFIFSVFSVIVFMNCDDA